MRGQAHLVIARRIATAVAGITLAAAVAACGFGPGKDVGGVDLTITRGFGAEASTDETVKDARESDTVMRILDSSADITTRYGGKFVQSIDGVAGGQDGGRPHDWFFFVNGVESEVGAADYPVGDGDRIWWDYRDWGSAQQVPAVVGAFPEPFLHGYADHEATVSVKCNGQAAEACEEVRSRLRGIGADLAGRGGAIRVLVGPWASVRADPAARALESGPETSGIFADFEKTAGGYSLTALDKEGHVTQDLGPGAGLVAATRRYGGPPTWLVTGGTADAALEAAGLLDPGDLRDHYAVARSRDEPIPLPTEAQ